MSGDFAIVFVCTGNRFRSPLAAAHVHALTAGLPVRVESMGTLELGAAPALPEALDWGRRAGHDLSSHRARYLVRESLTGADLVLGFEEMHIWDAVMDGGARIERSFTLPELVLLLESGVGGIETSDDVVGRARGAVALAHEARQPSRTSKRPEIDDPIGRGPAAFADAAARVEALTGELVAHLFRRASPAG